MDLKIMDLKSIILTSDFGNYLNFLIFGKKCADAFANTWVPKFSLFAFFLQGKVVFSCSKILKFSPAAVIS